MAIAGINASLDLIRLARIGTGRREQSTPKFVSIIAPLWAAFRLLYHRAGASIMLQPVSDGDAADAAFSAARRLLRARPSPIISTVHLFVAAGKAVPCRRHK